MEVVERRFRDTPKENKKYIKRLIEYISFLIFKGRVIEAKHFFHVLYKHKPHHARTIRLGYSLSIASFDNEGVRQFDRLLYDSKPKDIELYFFRLKYYISVNNLKNIEECCVFLLSKGLKKEQLNIVIEVCFNFESYVVASNLVKYLQKERLKLNDDGHEKIKRICLQRLVEVLEEAKCG